MHRNPAQKNGLKAVMAALLASAIVFSATDHADARSFADPFDASGDIPGSSPPPCGALPDTQHLTLINAINIALCRNPDTKSAWAIAQANAAELGKAQSAYLPSVTAGVAGTRSFSDDNRNGNLGTINNNSRGGTQTSYGPEASLNYLLYDFGGRESDVESARQSMLEAGWNANSIMQELVFRVVKAYTDVFSAEESLKAAQDAEAASEEAYKAAKARLDVGVVTPADTAQAETSFAQSTLFREQAENALSLARGTFATLLHLPPTHELHLAAVDPISHSNPVQKPVDELIAQALNSRPDLEAARAKEAKAKADLRRAKAYDYPSISLAGSAANQQYVSGNDTSRYDSSLTLRLSVPLFTGFKNTYQIESARHTKEAASADRERKEDDVSLDVWNTYNNYQTSQQTYKTAEALLKSARASESLSLGRYKAGKGTLIDALDAQAKLADARRQWVGARYNILVTRFDMIRALGNEDIVMPEEQKELAPLPGMAEVPQEPSPPSIAEPELEPR